jgi:hypothetical protein
MIRIEFHNLFKKISIFFNRRESKFKPILRYDMLKIDMLSADLLTLFHHIFSYISLSIWDPEKMLKWKSWILTVFIFCMTCTFLYDLPFLENEIKFEFMYKVFHILPILTYLRSWALLEEMSTVQPLKNPPAFHGTRSFNTVFTRALHWSLFRAISIQSTPSHSISLRSILILSTHPRLGLPSGLFPAGLPTNMLSNV